MKEEKSRFDKAMQQLDFAFQQAEEKENTTKEESESIRSTPAEQKQEPILSTPAEQKQESVRFTPPKKSPQNQQTTFDNTFQNAVENLKQRKQQQTPSATSPTAPEILEAPEEYPFSSEMKEKVDGLVEHSVHKKIAQLFNNILSIGEKEKKTMMDVDGMFEDTKRIRKYKTALQNKFTQFAHIKFHFYVNLGRSKITMEDLTNLKEGDILDTNISSNNLLDFYINQHSFGKGNIVASNFQRGFCIHHFNKKV